MATVVKKPKYTAKEKMVYQARKKEEKAGKKPTAPRQEIMHRVWADAHTGIDQKEINDRKAKKQCTQCTLTNHGWKHCKKETRISTIQRRPFKLPVGRPKPSRPQKLRVAAVADDSGGESSQQASQRPLSVDRYGGQRPLKGQRHHWQWHVGSQVIRPGIEIS